MRALIVIQFLLCYLVSSTQIRYYDSNWINDTICFNSTRLVLTLPEKSIEKSTEYIFKGEGKGLCYPLQASYKDEGTCRLEYLMIDQIVNTSYERLISNNEFDIELWNTFNNDHLGSRCFVKDGLYTRIDVLPSYIVVYYENLSSEMAETANQIIKSISTIKKASTDMVGNKGNRRVLIIE